jgi:anhydro-N-acetylmuramic acid kinase
LKIDLLQSKPAVIIGLMSGTSADAIDAAVMEIREEGQCLRWRLLRHVALPWTRELRAAILDACRADAPLQQITVLNFRLGEEFARAALLAADAAKLPFAEIAAIASHGQTIWHQPEPLTIGGEETIGTLQIGEAAVIAARTGCTVVTDFRPADMAVGGQGAPLAPFADYLLFADASETRAVQNLGGIANVTLLPAGCDLAGVTAFDTCPANMVLDALANLATGGALEYDRDGQFAAAGQVDPELLEGLLTHPFFAAPPPKSTGREEFGAKYAEALFLKGHVRGLSTADVLATATALTVESIAGAYRAFLLPSGLVDTVILGGGGTRNPTLVARLRERLAPAHVMMHSDFGVPDEAKEAAAFALLGYCTLRGRPSNVPSATGASRSTILGKIVLPPPC